MLRLAALFVGAAVALIDHEGVVAVSDGVADARLVAVGIQQGETVVDGRHQAVEMEMLLQGLADRFAVGNSADVFLRAQILIARFFHAVAQFFAAEKTAFRMVFIVHVFGKIGQIVCMGGGGTGQFGRTGKRAQSGLAAQMIKIGQRIHPAGFAVGLPRFRINQVFRRPGAHHETEH